MIIGYESIMEIPVAMVPLNLIFSIHVSKKDMRYLLMGKTNLMFFSVKIGEDDMG